MPATASISAAASFPFHGASLSAAVATARKVQREFARSFTWCRPLRRLRRPFGRNRAVIQPGPADPGVGPLLHHLLERTFIPGSGDRDLVVFGTYVDRCRGIVLPKRFWQAKRIIGAFGPPAGPEAQPKRPLT